MLRELTKDSEQYDTGSSDACRYDQWSGVFGSELGQEDVGRDNSASIRTEIHHRRSECSGVFLGCIVLHKRLEKDRGNETSCGNEEDSKVAHSHVGDG